MSTGQTYLIDTMAVNGRRAWHYMIDTSYGEHHVVQHVDADGKTQVDYSGTDNIRAGNAYHRITTRMLRGKE